MDFLALLLYILILQVYLPKLHFFQLDLLTAIKYLLKKKIAPVAQWIRRQPPELKIAGSIPAGRTSQKTMALRMKTLNEQPGYVFGVDHPPAQSPFTKPPMFLHKRPSPLSVKVAPVLCALVKNGKS